MTGNLPAELNRLVGRRQEIADVRRRLAEARLVTLTGVGGVGKTRVALRAALESRRAFPDGVWFVELSGLQDPELLAHTIGGVLGLQDQSVRPQADVLAEFLSGRRTLIVLDTCEHMVGPCAALAELLLSAAPKVVILVTSRQPLGVPGERVLGVQPLAEDAVELFYERAQGVDQAFDCERSLAERLCERLEGIPLAIELAAVRLRTLTPEQLLVRLDDRFRLLETPSPGKTRHQTLRTTIGWSHELCTPRERLLWARLSVFAWDFDLEGAEFVCSDASLPAGEVLDALGGLVDKSIVTREPGTTRFRMLDTVREYGEDWLVSLGDDLQLLSRHRDHYLRLARRFDRDWGGPEQLVWFDRMHAEFPNLRAALDFCLAEPAELDAGRELAVRLRFFWGAFGMVREGAYYLDRILASDRHVEALTARMWLATFQGRIDPRDIEELTAAAEGHGDAEFQAWTGYVLGNAKVLLGALSEARRLYAAALRGYRGLGAPLPGTALALAGHAFALSMEGQPERAIGMLEEQIALASAGGDRWSRSYGDWIYGLTELGMGRPAAAAAHALAALEVKRELYDRAGVAMAVDLLAAVAGEQGDGPRTARLLGAAHRLWRTFGLPQLGSPDLVAARRGAEGRAHALIGRDRFEAEFALGAGLTLEDALGYAFGEEIPQPRPGPEIERVLTHRQQEIAELVAGGLSNREIAERLVISKRTVDSHVEHILDKLGFGSRAQVAAWVARLGIRE
ncbi:ATP-binding protein [Actinocorallia longicatena]|uniref:LuxR family transcriptional regulator n=1 Tax=Actinocorallia longicatena TaxID=111803 RepID=A0ABP6Q2J3_9ACTN